MKLALAATTVLFTAGDRTAGEDNNDSLLVPKTEKKQSGRGHPRRLNYQPSPPKDEDTRTRDETTADPNNFFVESADGKTWQPHQIGITA